mmetsp:Transcript_3847/g.9810  ORF Transcript_3847/g.9810 Transcript_3847/m.9810 type:complete len:118 (+) Transcript_3847:114-467(+)|eukprot:CAMPEP_0181101964 /NCGR_PEP_ID=MMETSP1071-20121207/14050_1 /TAXON_ID=35127 /ORGANISM="Thalassiosira sp., Strain NH16" /LENGTH=117 /DNA_ID=CAMNT_0023184881 /DNA_START=87 /DNA_END=440 /DNA_ORIENTATION=-
MTSPNVPKMSDIKSCKLALPDHDYKNMSLVMIFYIALYSFLAGFYALMLKGVIATSRGGNHTLLWTFFVLGILFTVVVSLAVYVSQYQEKMKNDDPPKKSHTVDLERMMREDVLHCV